MCAVIGVYLEEPTKKQIETLKNLFIESQIRGRHQCGLSYNTGHSLVRFVVEGDGEKLVEEFDWSALERLPTLELVGHNRYSTSDLRFPQPIQINEDFSLCHNGVVTQKPFDQWGEYGYTLQTQNDSELLWQASYIGRKPLLEFPNASMAVCELHMERGISWYRNGKRPLYQTKVKNGWFVCSTRDIAERSGLTGAEKCIPGVVYQPNGYTKIAEVSEMIG